MAEARISVERVGKKLCRNLKRSLWYGVSDLAAESIGRQRSRDQLRRDEFWAVDDVSFELAPGDSLGLIGPNGAGKTTLLRMLNGLIRPDKGRIEVRGRMQALIALGVGFSPILTGRENAYVNAAVLGIPKSQIDRRLDEIIDFSGVGEFIDSPVKNYSSGMLVRLGFAVSVHLEPDILLVDEVLAVGDVSFRAKCSRKLAELKDKGIPWILVSHDLGLIRNQTNRAIFLDSGRCAFQGSPDDAIAAYLVAESEREHQQSGSAPNVAPVGDGEQLARIEAVHTLDASGQPRSAFHTGQALTVRIDYEAFEPIAKPCFGIAFLTGDGSVYTGTNTAVSGFPIDAIDGRGSVSFALRHLPFVPGLYRIRIALRDGQLASCIAERDVGTLRVEGGRFGAGLFHPEHEWRLGEPE